MKERSTRARAAVTNVDYSEGGDMFKKKKITVVGAGNVGASFAAYAAAQELGDVVLVDVVEGVPQGKALDMFESTSVLGVDVRAVGTNSYEETSGSDIIVITAGLPRKPGMSRDELLVPNFKIVGEVAEKSARLSPDAVMIVVSNPLDAMVYTAWKRSGLPPRRVIGMAGVLDTARLRRFLADELGVSVQDIQALVLGGHGRTMVPLTRYCHVGGINVTNFISADRLEQIVQRTRDGGAEIVSLLKTGSAYYAAAASILEMVRSILLDQKRLLPVAAYLDGEFGEKGIFVGVPAILGAQGVERIVELELIPREKEAFDKSVAAVKGLVQEIDQLLLPDSARAASAG